MQALPVQPRLQVECRGQGKSQISTTLQGRARCSGLIVAVLGVALWWPHQTSGQSPSEVAADTASLPSVTALPSGFEVAGALANRGTFYAAGGRLSFRQDDEGAYHGSDSLPVWEQSQKTEPTQGVLYGVEDGHIVSAGYLLRQQDLIGGKSFRQLSLRGLDFPAPQRLTLDFMAEGDAADHYLLLSYFRAREGASSRSLASGALPPVTTLPPEFSLYACTEHPNDFCPRMGRHYRDTALPATRPPTATGDASATYGEAAGKLVFIEYVLSQGDLVAGTSFEVMSLDRLAIPPIDNLHLLHYNGVDAAPGRYTVHMYFVPEATYLSWHQDAGAVETRATSDRRAGPVSPRRSCRPPRSHSSVRPPE